MVTKEGFRSDMWEWSGAFIDGLPGSGEDGVNDLWLALDLAGFIFEKQKACARSITQVAVYAREPFCGVLVVIAPCGPGT